MQRLRRFIRQWLGFSRTETNGFMVLLPLMLFLIFSEPVYRWWISSIPEDFSSESRYLDSLAELLEGADHNSSKAIVVSVPTIISLQPFDPNEISPEDMKRLGFIEHLSKRIAGYREKGGVFRVKRDLMKIYGMDSTFYNQLYPYILLPETDEKQKTINKKGNGAFSKNFYEPDDPFDLNKADTATLKLIKGIGPVLAERIIKFRSSLGGFTDKGQIKEVYGLDTTVIKKLDKASFIENGYEPVKIDLNNSDEKTLDAHPYITRTIARAIVAYRYQHGNFTSVEDVRKISIITPENAEKLLPYLKAEK